MQNAGIQNNQFFQYSPETQAFNYAVIPKVDPYAYAKSVTSQHAKDPYGIEYKNYTIGGKQKRETKVLYGMVDDKETADKIYQENIKLNGGNINNVTRPYSGDDLAIAYFNQPGALEQYMDLHPEVTPETIMQHYKDNYYQTAKKNSMGLKTEGAGGLNIVQNVSMGEEEKATYFDFDKSPNTYKIVGNNVTSIGKMALSRNNIPYDGAISKQFFNPKTGQPATGELGNSKLIVGELIALPIETNADGSIRLIDGKINVLKNETLNEFKTGKNKPGTYFKYKPMAVLRQKNNLGAPDLLDSDYITEFKNIKSTFYMNIPSPTKSIDSRKEFENNYAIMEKEIQKAEANYRPVK